MSSTRLWVVLLAGVSFLAGFAGGILTAPGMIPPLSHGPFAAYEQHFAETFELSAEERSNLRHVLDRYQRELQELEARNERHPDREHRAHVGRNAREMDRVLERSDARDAARADARSVRERARLRNARDTNRSGVVERLREIVQAVC